MEELFIPTLHTFAMKNPFTGSAGLFRFRIVPDVHMRTPKEVDFDASTMSAECWHGLFCYEKSEVEDKQVFPLTEEGRENMRRWLIEHV